MCLGINDEYENVSIWRFSGLEFIIFALRWVYFFCNIKSLQWEIVEIAGMLLGVALMKYVTAHLYVQY